MKFRIETNTFKGLLIHASIALGFFCILSFTVFDQVLPLVTNKDKIVTVPDLKGMSFDGARKLAREKELNIEVIDSAFNPEYAPLIILEQFPRPNAKVKIDRKINVTINAKIPPSIAFPDLSGSTFEFAQRQLQNLDLRIGTVAYRPDIAHNAILESRVNGQKVSAGQRIAKGSRIDLVIGTHRETFALPNFERMPLGEVEAYILGMNLKLGRIHHLRDAKQEVGTVKKQLPNAGDTVRLGDEVELWITTQHRSLDN